MQRSSSFFFVGIRTVEPKALKCIHWDQNTFHVDLLRKMSRGSSSVLSWRLLLFEPRRKFVKVWLIFYLMKTEKLKYIHSCLKSLAVDFTHSEMSRISSSNIDLLLISPFALSLGGFISLWSKQLNAMKYEKHFFLPAEQS